VLEADTSGAAVPKKGTFRVPNAVFDDAAKRAHLSAADMQRALNFEGTAAHQCRARFGLLDAALAGPHDVGLPLLREM